MDVISQKWFNDSILNLLKANQFSYFLQGSRGDGLAVEEIVQEANESG